jgi:hypothetical protein
LDFLLYGIFKLGLVDPAYISNQKFLELVRSPIATILGIFGAILVPLLAQSNVRSGLIGLSLASLFVMTGLVFSGAVFSAYGLIFLAARLLRSWACRRGKAGLPLIAAWIFVNALYLPVFFITYPPFEGFMAAGEIALFLGHWIHGLPGNPPPLSAL